MDKQPEHESANEAAEPPSSDTPRAAETEGKRSLLRGLFGFLNKGSEEAAAREAVAEAAAAPHWTAQEKLMLANIGELHSARVEDIMIPRSDIKALDIEDSLGEALRLFEESGHSRMPVYAETLDDPRGMIHIRDVLNYITRVCLSSASAAGGASAASGVSAESGASAAGAAKTDGAAKAKSKNNVFAALDLTLPIGGLGIIREVLFVPDSMPAGRLLARMQAGRLQMALVIDEHGGTDGLVSMEDIVELIVGDIEDEHDTDDGDDIVREAQNSWVLDAATELEELEERLGIDFSENNLAQDVDTIGGLVVMALDRIPARGEKLTLAPHYLVQILDADRRRVKRIRLTRLDGAAS